MSSEHADRPDGSSILLRPELLVFCGLMGFIGTIAPTVMNLIASFVAEHDIIADTISDLGRGPHSWIMDTGFYINAAGLIALAIGTAHAHLGGPGWSLGVFSLALTALVTVLVGVWDEFGNGEDLSIHTRLTFFLGPLYFFGPLLMASGVRSRSDTTAVLFYAAAVLWLVFATAFKLAPNSYDGILEKIAVLATLLWTLPLAKAMIALGRERAE